MDETGTKNYNGIDIMKFTCSILVICMHTNPLSTYSEYLNFALVQVVGRIAVPFFFIASGYLLFREMSLPLSQNEHNWFAIMKYIKRILTIYVVWSAIYFIFILDGLIKTNSVNLKSIPTCVWNFIYLGSYYHLWYLPALIFSVLAFYWLLKYFSIKRILIISTIFYIIGLFGDSYYGIIKNNQILENLFTFYFKFFITTRNGLFFGLIFVTLGAYIGKSVMTTRKAKTYLLFSFGFMFLEAFTLKYFNIPKDSNMLISLLPVTFFLFTVLINVEIKDNKIYKYFRDSSILIYCSHIIFTILLPILFEIAGLQVLYTNSLVKFVLVTSCSLIFSFGILFLVQNRRFQWLKILY